MAISTAKQRRAVVGVGRVTYAEVLPDGGVNTVGERAILAFTYPEGMGLGGGGSGKMRRRARILAITRHGRIEE